MKSNDIMCSVILLESLVIISISTKSWETISEKLLGRMKTILINQRMIGRLASLKKAKAVWNLSTEAFVTKT